jgi:hypothetical protein
LSTTIDPRLEGLPVERIKRRTFDRLYEYSCSMPTGVIPGKVWRRDLNFGTSDRTKCWVLGEYTTKDENTCYIEWRRPEIIEET